MPPKNIQKTRWKYDVEFKAEVPETLAIGQSVAYVANTLGVSDNLIYRWKTIDCGWYVNPYNELVFCN